LAEPFDPFEVPEAPSEVDEEPDEGEGLPEGVPDFVSVPAPDFFVSVPAPDFSPDSLLSAFFRASEG
jgi:hypothetical protein